MENKSNFEIESQSNKSYQKIESYPETVKPSDSSWLDSKSMRTVIKIAILAIIIVIAYFAFVRSGLLKRFIVVLYAKLSNLYKNHEVVFFVVFSILVFIMIVLLIPLKSLTCMVGILVIRNPIISFVLLHWTFTCASVFIYFISKMFLYDYIYSKVKHNDYFIVIKEQSIKHPWKTAFIARLLYIPTGLKDCILVMVDIPIKQYIISAIVIHAQYVAELIAVTYQLRNIHDMFGEEKSWRDKTKLEKCIFGLSFVLVAIMIGLMAFISYWAKKQVEKKRKEAPYKSTEQETLDNV